MQKYKEYISINKNFKSSVNLLYDLNSEEKIDNFIPTTDLCDVIKSYIKCVLGKCDFRATVLEGPYGKGKSYLMLVICYLVSSRKNKTVFKRLINKIKIIDLELYDLINDLDRKRIKLLPVIINNNYYDDLNKNFLVSLRNSLENEKIENVIPKSSYKEALDIIDIWKKNADNDFRIEECCKNPNINISLDELIEKLNKYDGYGYNKFLDLYSCINHGISFKTFVTDDIVPVYHDVLCQITKYGFSGIFIVFDEFGSFLENQTSDFSIKLNKIQNLSEVCNNSSQDLQMHFCCITHKDLSLYSKDKNIIDRFKQISGRFKQIRFDRSLDENYQLICSAINKNDLYPDINKKFIKDNKTFIRGLYDAGFFFDKAQIDYILKNGYPFNPVTLFALIQVSEKIAQNERTLFTYLSDSSESGFKFFINNKGIGDGLLNVDSIYDYFEELIKNNEDYNSLYYKVESLKRNIFENDSDNGLDATLHSIFKVIAIIKIINDDIKYSASLRNIALSLNLPEDIVQTKLDMLIRKNILKRNINNTYDFEIIADSYLNKMISDVVETKYANMEVSNLLSKYDESKYYVSHEYNFNYKMTRFYKVVYIEASKILLLSSLDDFYQEQSKQEFCDGIIFDVINDVELSREDINNVLKNNSYNIIIRINKNSIDNYVIDKIKMIFAAQELINTKAKIFSTGAIDAMSILIDDAKNQVHSYLDEYFSDAELFNKASKKSFDLKQCINASLEKYYPKTIIFNNEQINKNELSVVTTKARNYVVDCFLNKNELDVSPTSQEGTIYSSFENSERTEDVIKLIRTTLISSKSEKTSFEELINKLVSSPYGMRKGIIPLFIADVISKISMKSEYSLETVILYNENVEIDLNSINLSRVVENPERYYFNYAKINNDKLNMFVALCNVFNVKANRNFTENLNDLVLLIKQRVSSLPGIIIKSSAKDNLLNLDHSELAFKNLVMKFNINNYEFVFEELPKTLRVSFGNVAKNVRNMLNSYDRKVEFYFDKVIDRTKTLFSYNEGSLKASVDLWLSQQTNIDEIIFEDADKRIYHALLNLNFNDNESINIIANACVNITLNDFNNQKEDDFYRVLEHFMNEVNEKRNSLITKNDFSVVDVSPEFSPLGNTLYANIQEEIDSYGDSISNEEKALILKKMLSDLLK